MQYIENKYWGDANETENEFSLKHPFPLQHIAWNTRGYSCSYMDKYQLFT